MKKEHLAFLVGGLAFGVLFGYALFVAVENSPGAARGSASDSIPGPAGPPAPTQIVDGGAPMMREINELKRQLQDDAGNLAALLRLGDLYRTVGMWEQAEQYYSRAVEVDPEDRDLKKGLAHLFHEAERWDLAVKYYSLVLEDARDDPDLLTDLGVCFRELGQYDRALELFNEARTHDDTHWQALFNTVVVAGFNLDRLDDAETALELLERVKPDAPGLERLREALRERRISAEAGGAS